jgi:hypothetical protein
LHKRPLLLWLALLLLGWLISGWVGW